MSEPQKTEVSPFETLIVVCTCSCLKHMMALTFDPDAEFQECWLEVRLNNYLGFWARLWNGIKYIFGHKSKYGDFDTVLLDKVKAGKLRDALDSFIATPLASEKHKHSPNDNITAC